MRTHSGEAEKSIHRGVSSGFKGFLEDLIKERENMSNWNNRFFPRVLEEIPIGFIRLSKGKAGWSCDHSQRLVFPRGGKKKLDEGPT
jgi:hypothetical protein